MGRGKTDLDELRANILAESLELVGERLASVFYSIVCTTLFQLHLP